MIVGFLYADKPRERLLAEAVIAGVRSVGDEAWAAPKGGDLPDADVYGMVGVKSLDLFRQVHRLESHVLYFDKGYQRHRNPHGPGGWEYWRVALDSHQPTAHLMDDWPSDRWGRWERSIPEWREGGAHILIAGSSEKYHNWYGLPHPTQYAAKLAKRIRKLTDRKIVYRPKPSWRAAEEIEGTVFSPHDQPLSAVLDGAWALVTHGSNACADAVFNGVPAIVLGEGVAKPISSTAIEDVLSPCRASMEDRLRWAAGLAWWQWTRPEIAQGLMWSALRQRLLGCHR